MTFFYNLIYFDQNIHPLFLFYFHIVHNNEKFLEEKTSRVKIMGSGKINFKKKKGIYFLIKYLGRMSFPLILLFFAKEKYSPEKMVGRYADL